MSKITEDSPVNPSSHQAYNRHGDKEGTPYQHKGLTIRQHFASLFMAGTMSNPEAMEYLSKKRMCDAETSAQIIASKSVLFADALISELNKEK